jgi:hypothetical protein
MNINNKIIKILPSIKKIKVSSEGMLVFVFFYIQ